MPVLKLGIAGGLYEINEIFVNHDCCCRAQQVTDAKDILAIIRSVRAGRETYKGKEFIFLVDEDLKKALDRAYGIMDRRDN